MNILTDQELLELHELLDSLVENNLPKARLVRLEKWIADNDFVRREYVKFMDLNSSLRHYAEELVSDEIEEFTKENSPKLLPFLKPLFAIAAILVLGLFFYKDIKSLIALDDAETRVENKPSEKFKSLNDSVIVDTVAVLTKTVGVRWEEEAKFRPNLGDTLESSTLKISDGLAQVEFLQGATVVLEGPVDFSIENPNEGKLSVGKLRAIVPKVATGFTINLPKGRVIDLGTDFGLHVHPGGSTELFVYQGNVIYEGTTDANEKIVREITGGESIFVDPYGHLNWVEMPSEPFISAADLAFRSMEESQRRHASWIDLSNSISQRETTMLYFTFDNQSSWSRVLKDQSPNSSSSQNGAIVGCSWEEGRWSGKGALSFKRTNDRVRLELPYQLSSATFVAWLKIDSLDKDISPILCSDPQSIGSTCRSINKNGQVVLRTRTTKGNVKYESSVAFRPDNLNRWTHVATTYDSETKMITHFVNGRTFSREKLTEPVVLNFPKAMLGHSVPSDSSKKGLAFKGSIDEFGIFNDSYSEEEIRNIYEIGRPYEIPSRIGSRIP